MSKLTIVGVLLLAAISISIIGTGIISQNLERSFVEKPLQKLDFSNGSFTILQLTDFHEWAGKETDNGIVPQDSLKPRLTMFFDQVMSDVDPDLVILTGDNIFPLSFLWDFLGNVSITTLRYIADYFEEKEQLWTLTFGNHDTESAVTKEAFLSSISSYNYFIGEETESSIHKSFRQEINIQGQANRVANYSIPIFSNGRVNFNIFVLDSGSYYQPGNGPRDYLAITPEQTSWYCSEVARLQEENGQIIPSLLFTHIPFIEMAEIFESYSYTIYGLYGGISNSSIRSNIYDECFINKDVKGIFFGHNHYNSLTLFEERDNHIIMMGITPQASGESYDDLTSDMYGRVITIKESGDFSTYIYSSKEISSNHIFLGQTISYSSFLP
ncbi:MAG: metallophosphoesterase [Clostridia bacterium]